MELPGTLWERASTALQRLKKLPNLVCLSTLAGLGRVASNYATAQAFVRPVRHQASPQSA